MQNNVGLKKRRSVQTEEKVHLQEEGSREREESRVVDPHWLQCRSGSSDFKDQQF